jgi:hypothetical protein
LAVSFLAYRNQQQSVKDQLKVNAAASAAAAAHVATQVSFWKGNGTLTVENLSNQIVSNVIFWPLDPSLNKKLLTIPDLQPCSINTVRELVHNGTARPLDISFTLGGTLSGGFTMLTFSDPSGQIWARTSQGNLWKGYQDSKLASLAQRAEQPLYDPPPGEHTGVVFSRPGRDCG